MRRPTASWLRMGALSKEARIRGAIHERANEISQRRRYIGLWEWIAWGCLQRRPVHVLFGETLIDVFQVSRVLYERLAKGAAGEGCGGNDGEVVVGWGGWRGWGAYVCTYVRT